MAPDKLIFVTGNANKLREVGEILGDTVALESRAIDLPELQGTITEISKDKCRRAAEAVSLDGSEEEVNC
jgi:inosine triphosphate pyrophosphatase